MAATTQHAMPACDGGNPTSETLGEGWGSYPLKNIRNPHSHDVLCGRGGGTNNHIGNNHWRTLVGANKRLYISLPKRQKMLVAQSIVRAVRSQNPPGRFLQKDSASNTWFDIGDQKAQDKTSQALREGAPTIRQEMRSQHDPIPQQHQPPFYTAFAQPLPVTSNPANFLAPGLPYPACVPPTGLSSSHPPPPPQSISPLMNGPPYSVYPSPPIVPSGPMPPHGHGHPHPSMYAGSMPGHGGQPYPFMPTGTVVPPSIPSQQPRPKHSKSRNPNEKEEDKEAVAAAAAAAGGGEGPTKPTAAAAEVPASGESGGAKKSGDSSSLGGVTDIETSSSCSSAELDRKPTKKGKEEEGKDASLSSPLTSSPPPLPPPSVSELGKASLAQEDGKGVRADSENRPTKTATMTKKAARKRENVSSSEEDFRSERFLPDEPLPPDIVRGLMSASWPDESSDSSPETRPQQTKTDAPTQTTLHNPNHSHRSPTARKVSFVNKNIQNPTVAHSPAPHSGQQRIYFEPDTAFEPVPFAPEFDGFSSYPSAPQSRPQPDLAFDSDEDEEDAGGDEHLNDAQAQLLKRVKAMVGSSPSANPPTGHDGPTTDTAEPTSLDRDMSYTSTLSGIASIDESFIADMSITQDIIRGGQMTSLSRESSQTDKFVGPPDFTRDLSLALSEMSLSRGPSLSGPSDTYSHMSNITGSQFLQQQQQQQHQLSYLTTTPAPDDNDHNAGWMQQHDVMLPQGMSDVSAAASAAALRGDGVQYSGYSYDGTSNTASSSASNHNNDGNNNNNDDNNTKCAGDTPSDGIMDNDREMLEMMFLTRGASLAMERFGPSYDK